MAASRGSGARRPLTLSGPVNMANITIADGAGHLGTITNNAWDEEEEDEEEARQGEEEDALTQATTATVTTATSDAGENRSTGKKEGRAKISKLTPGVHFYALQLCKSIPSQRWPPPPNP